MFDHIQSFVQSVGLPAQGFCLINQKGGVGKTTSAVNLSSAFARAGYRTLLVDLDPQANASSVYADDVDVVDSAYDVMMYGADARAIYQVRENLWLLPSTPKLREVEVVSEIAVDVHTCLDQYLKHYAESHPFDFVVADCPPALNLLSYNALYACPNAVVPVQCEYYALEGFSQLLETISTLNDSWPERKVRVFGVLRTMFDTRLRLNHEVAEDLAANVPGYLLNTIIPRNVAVAEAPSQMQSVLDYSATCKGSQAYLAASSEIIRRISSFAAAA